MIANWAGKRVLVCGGAGMIGSHVARRLLHEGAVVSVADDLSSGSERNIADIRDQVDFHRLDLRDYGACQSVADGKDCIFQFAADMGGIGYITAIGADIMRNSVSINLNMLQAAQQCSVPEYFYSSSACVYPEYLQTEAEVSPLKETDAYPAQPDQFYGWERR
jgi:nucleoside-diphosphate-sugar epimerase